MSQMPLVPEPPKDEWLYEKEPLNPRLVALIRDIHIYIDRHVQLRKHRHSREWL